MEVAALLWLFCGFVMAACIVRAKHVDNGDRSKLDWEHDNENAHWGQ